MRPTRPHRNSHQAGKKKNQSNRNPIKQRLKPLLAVEPDARVFARFIQQFVQRFRYEDAPKFLFGESYGTVRAVLVAEKLRQLGILLSGMVLNSCVLNYANTETDQGTPDVVYVGLLPTYAATGWYHNARVRRAFPDLGALLDRAEHFAASTLLPALQGDTDARVCRRTQVVGVSRGFHQLHTVYTRTNPALLSELEAMTGIPAHTWHEKHLRLSSDDFRRRVARGHLVGRYDTRFRGALPPADSGDDAADPSSVTIENMFYAGTARLLAHVLGPRNPLRQFTYRSQLPDAVVSAWDFRQPDKGQQQGDRRLVNVSTALGRALDANPFFARLCRMRRVRSGHALLPGAARSANREFGVASAPLDSILQGRSHELASQRCMPRNAPRLVGILSRAFLRRTERDQ